MSTDHSADAGFSLVELLVAMVITVIISGAIFGLISGGQSAFRREPEMTERQQTIRVAMNSIKRDVAAAGAGMVPFVQAFTTGLDGLGGAPSTTQTAGSSGQPTDILEILTSTGECRPAFMAVVPPPAAGPLASNETLPRCFPDTAAPASFFYVGSDDPTERDAYGVVLGKANVAAGVNPFGIILTNAATANLNPTAPSPSAGFCTRIAGGAGTPTCRVVMPVEVARYQIASDPTDPAVPALWRSRTGRFDSLGNVVAAPPGGNWEVVARGIEDLQVTYMNGAGVWSPNPGSVYCVAPCTPPLATDLNRVVRQVTITLSARATGRNLQGMTTAGGGAGNAIRGQLIGIAAPRAALQTLTLTPGSAAGWY